MRMLLVKICRKHSDDNRRGYNRLCLSLFLLSSLLPTLSSFPSSLSSFFSSSSDSLIYSTIFFTEYLLSPCQKLFLELKSQWWPSQKMMKEKWKRIAIQITKPTESRKASETGAIFTYVLHISKWHLLRRIPLTDIPPYMYKRITRARVTPFQELAEDLQAIRASLPVTLT